MTEAVRTAAAGRLPIRRQARRDRPDFTDLAIETNGLHRRVEPLGRVPVLDHAMQVRDQPPMQDRLHHAPAARG